ncbi:DNA-binding protein [Methylobacterium sp. WL30]|uniref:DNA-binding protein n=1 Tax=unclassified Methylobacterium TaxID=2615210 RepID=UPI0011C95596|nr:MULTISPECIES: DNA-binding protein [unclassified Methylobacterium]TXN40433.1 DNA-binding protein [Methylobacterium sp. WL93]TXN49142.1 DNA-binding protein [Methylobacterium sp. WL119]TXN68977.1 DNA-binding protein [Methylobacterium sp. WL30]
MTNVTTRPSGANDTGLPLAEDMMTGAEAIAKFMFGDATETNKRRVYHAADKLGLPTFRLGGTLCARRSTILRWIEAQESAA